MKKEEFIEQYTQIHEKISCIEREIDHFINNKDQIVENPLLLQDLKNRLEKEIETLNKTREHERQVFQY
jgi:hypothetical protein